MDLHGCVTGYNTTRLVPNIHHHGKNKLRGTIQQKFNAAVKASTPVMRGKSKQSDLVRRGDVTYVSILIAPTHAIKHETGRGCIFLNVATRSLVLTSN